ncbi:DNA topoisomerase 3 [Klebsiella spallanzanii]|nr:DNA topoisomerase 3 [Klebsiella spallanzanii]
MKLFLCEKPSQGRDIAAVLGATKKMPGYQTGNGVCVTWGCPVSVSSRSHRTDSAIRWLRT